MHCLKKVGVRLARWSRANLARTCDVLHGATPPCWVVCSARVHSLHPQDARMPWYCLLLSAQAALAIAGINEVHLSIGPGGP